MYWTGIFVRQKDLSRKEILGFEWLKENIEDWGYMYQHFATGRLEFY